MRDSAAVAAGGYDKPGLGILGNKACPDFTAMRAEIGVGRPGKPVLVQWALEGGEGPGPDKWVDHSYCSSTRLATGSPQSIRCSHSFHGVVRLNRQACWPRLSGVSCWWPAVSSDALIVSIYPTLQQARLLATLSQHFTNTAGDCIHTSARLHSRWWTTRVSRSGNGCRPITLRPSLSAQSPCVLRPPKLVYWAPGS